MFLCCPFFFIVSRLYLPSVSDRSAGLVRCRCCCCSFVRGFSSFLGLNCYHVRIIIPQFLAITRVRLHVLREPADTLAVALAHDDGAHEDLHGADALESNLALASCNKHQESVQSPSSTTNITIIIPQEKTY
jgi:hypothetical protein